MDYEAALTIFEQVGIDASNLRGKKLKAAHRSLVWKYHPDRPGQPKNATETLARINAAYDVISAVQDAPDPAGEKEPPLGWPKRAYTNTPDVDPDEDTEEAAHARAYYEVQQKLNAAILDFSKAVVVLLAILAGTFISGSLAAGILLIGFLAIKFRGIPTFFRTFREMKS